jgi:exonuclease SbcD
MLKIAHAADFQLHQSGAYGGKIIRDDSGQNLKWVDQQRAVKAFVASAIERGCELALLVGDLFETARPSPAEIVFAQSAIRRLAERMPVVLCQGNHDPCVGTDPSVVEALSLPNVHVITRPGIALPLPGVRVGVVPYPTRSILLAKDEYSGIGPEQVTASISEKLQKIVRGLRSQQDDGFNLLMAHLTIQGASIGEDQASYLNEISLTPDDLEGWDCVALGHIHRFQAFGERAWYCGSTQRNNFGEEHDRCGWCYVELDGAGAAPRVELVETPARRFVTLTVDELVNSEPLPEIVYRVKAKIGQEEFDAIKPDLARWRAGTQLFSEEVEVTRQTRARDANMRGDLSPVAALEQWCTANGKTDMLPALREAHRELAGAGK